MPTNAPSIKVNAVRYSWLINLSNLKRGWGKEFATIELIGDTFDDSFKAALEFCT